MNTFIQKAAQEQEPKIKTLNPKEGNYYKLGLNILGAIVGEDFFDLPKLPEDRFSQDGLFYNIPFFDDEQLWTSENQRILVVVYQIIANHSSHCPFRIDFKYIDEQNFVFYVYEQGERTIKKELLSFEKGKYYTEIENYTTIKLSELVKNHLKSTNVAN